MASLPIKPAFNAEAIPAFTVGAAQSVDLQPEGGTPPYKCDVTQGNLPAGLTFSSAGTLSGTAQTPNDDAPPTVWFRVTESFGLQGTRAYPVSVRPRQVHKRPASEHKL
ncbi:MAG TPA: Ig domain-containing protein [Pyrinomonadaceae bacterium]